MVVEYRQVVANEYSEILLEYSEISTEYSAITLPYLLPPKTNSTTTTEYPCLKALHDIGGRMVAKIPKNKCTVDLDDASPKSLSKSPIYRTFKQVMLLEMLKPPKSGVVGAKRRCFS